jgi:hypothetical protein
MGKSGGKEPVSLEMCSQTPKKSSWQAFVLDASQHRYRKKPVSEQAQNKVTKRLNTKMRKK